jgi:subtilisin-like proprotein convertase family protein
MLSCFPCWPRFRATRQACWFANFVLTALLFFVDLFSVSVRAVEGTVANTSPITIPVVGIATSYPSTITVSEIEGSIATLTLTLYNISHTWPDDLDILLVGPSGVGVVVFSDAGGGHSMTNITVTLDDEAPYPLPYQGAIPSGTYRPTDYEPGDLFPSPAAAAAYETTLSAFVGLPALGTWSLYVVDDGPSDSGVIAGGWSLTISTDGGTGPSISDLPDQAALPNTPTAAIPFTIDDPDTPISDLILTASSSNPTLVPNENIHLGGSDSSRTIMIVPAPNQRGAAIITVRVSDGIAVIGKSFQLTVSPPQLIVTADNATRNYGSADPLFTGTIVGLKNGDNITPVYASAATAFSPVGSYAITPSLLDPDGKLGNYGVVLKNGKLKVAPALLTGQADNKTRSYATANPEFTVSYSGFVNDEDPTFVTGTLTGSTPAETDSPPGTYPITVSGQSASNYTILYLEGTLTVTSSGYVAITSIERVLPNQVRITGTGNAGTAYIVEGSSDLVRWATIGATAPAAPDGAFEFQVADFSEVTNRFYRVASP